MSWAYSQKTGELSRNGSLIAPGYSGHGEGLNNPDMETVPEVGPIPTGSWTMSIIKGEDGMPCDWEHKHAPVIRLKANASTETFGRDGFLIHGDLIGHEGEEIASKGCIVVTKFIRDQIAVSITEGDDQLQVTQ